jgi:membrane protease YdiL (CAAX protease family)
MSFETLVPYLIEWAAILGLTLLASTSSRFKHSRVTFNYVRREGIGALILGGFVLVLAAGFYFLRPVQLELADDRLNLILLELIVAGIAALPLGSTLLARKQKLFTAGWLPGTLKSGLLFGVSIAILLIFLAGKFMGILDGLTSTEIIALAALLGMTVLEESIFRGYIQCRLEAWLGERVGWLLVAGLWILWSLPAMWVFGLLTPLNLVIMVVRGLIAGWVMQKAGHTLAPAFYRAFAMWLMFLQ